MPKRQRWSQQARTPDHLAKLEHVAQGMSLEQIAELGILAEHVEALVPAEALELGGVGALSHAGGECAAFEAMAAEFQPPEPGGNRARLDDAGDRARGECRGAEAGRGG